MYNKTVQNYFFSPDHVGVIDLNQNLAVMVKNNQKGQGDIEFYMRCDAQKVIQTVRFKTNGNPYLIAGLEWLCRQIEKQNMDHLSLIDYQRLIKELDIPITQYPLAVRIIDVLKKTLVLMGKNY